MNLLCRKKIKKTIKLDRYVTGRGNLFELSGMKKRSLCLPFLGNLETTSKTYILHKPTNYPASIYLVKVNNKNTRT